MATLQTGYENLNRPSTIRVVLALGALLRLEGIARQYGLTRGEAIAEAVREWTVRREHSLKRADRLRLERAMRGAVDGASPRELLALFRGGSGVGLKDSSSGRKSVGDVVYSQNMPTPTLVERRKAAGLSQQKLAEKAGCSVSTVRLLECGYTPRESEKAEQIKQALTEAERETA